MKIQARVCKQFALSRVLVMIALTCSTCAWALNLHDPPCSRYTTLVRV